MARVRYSDRNQWPSAADGTGHTLALKDPYLDPDDNDNWTWSQSIGGTPGGPNFDEPTVIETEILPQDSTWRYLKGFNPYPAGWKEDGFDDSDWLAGQTGIGYGDGDDRTVLSDMQGGYISFAARRVLDLTQEEIDEIDDLALQLSYDDGFVFYVNGVEVARAYLDTGPGDVPHTATAGLHEASGFEVFPFSSSVLRAGPNILAAQVHNNTLGSSDSSFVPRLVSTRTVFPNPAGEPVPIVLNECFSRTDGERWIELYNTSDAAVDISGFLLGDSPSALDLHALPPDSVVPAHGFLRVTESESGLNFTGEELPFFLTRPNLSQVIAAEIFENPPLHDPPLEGTSDARYPDGGGRFFISSTPTPGLPNEVFLETSIVISEIMYHPPRERSELEYVELFNRGESALNIGGCRFNRGIDYTFPPGTVLPAGDYIVVAADPAAVEDAHLFFGVHGPYEGQLDNGGELLRLVDPYGNIMDQVRYYDGGRWSPWADGGGSSLELLDPYQDNSVASAWEASDESSKSEWEEIQFTLSNYPQQIESEFQIRMLDASEVLVDDVRLQRGATQYVRNGDFETGTTYWIIDGNHVQSHRTTEDAFSGSACLKVVATGDGDTRVNRIETETSPFMTSGTYEGHVAARWLRGGNLIYLSGFRQPAQFQVTHWLTFPLNLGSPGRRNSVSVDNLGPVISEVRHDPAVPGGSQEVTVVARVSDFDGVDSVTARYRRGSGGGSFESAPLFDDGDHDDGVAGDGLYGGVIPGHVQGSRVVYYVEAIDSRDAIRTFPRQAPNRTLVYRHDNPLSAQAFTYRVIHDDATWNLLNSRELHSNELLDATFIFNEEEVYYNVGTRYRGSPWNRPGNPRMYRVRFGEDKTYRGRRAINLSRYGNAQRERAAYHAVWRNSTPSVTCPKSRAAFTRVQTNAGLYTMEHVEPVNSDYLSLWFPQDDDGFVYKITGKQIFDDSGNHMTNLISWATYANRGTLKANYRWNFNPRTRELEDNFTELAEMMRVINGSSALLDTELEKIMDVEQFLRVYAARCAHDDWDTIAIGNGQNAYFYFAPVEGRFKLLPWDMDHSWGNVDARIYPDRDGSFNRVIQRPKFRRMYLAILDEMINGRGSQPGYWSGAEMVTKLLDRNSAEVGSDGVSGAGGIRNFINARRTRLAGQLPPPLAFNIITNGGDPLTVDTREVTIDGNAWVDVYSIAVGEDIVQPSWVTTTRWRVTVALDAGANELDFLAFDVTGNLIDSDQITVTSTFGWETPEITGVEPPQAMPGETVVVAGSDFHGGLQVFFAGELSPDIAFDEASDPGHVSAEVSFLPPGEVELTVENTDGRRSAPFAFTVLPLPPRFVRGDVNLDGIVDISDPIRLLLHLFGGLEAPCLDAGDADDDESLNVTDAIIVLQFLFQDGEAPNAPFPTPGEDPTDTGALDCESGVDLFGN